MLLNCFCVSKVAVCGQGFFAEKTEAEKHKSTLI